MKKNKAFIIITTLILALLFTILAGCDFTSQADIDKKEVEKSIEYAKSAEQEREKINEEDKKYLDELYAEEQKEKEQAEGTELLENEEIPIPNEPITYHTELVGVGYDYLEGLEITLTINFRTLDVTGNGAKGGADPMSFNIDGKIVDIATLEIYANASGSSDVQIIGGHVSEDLSMFDGFIMAQSINYKFTASR